MEREYLAYISYRHTEVDKEAAIAIQRQLEHYRIPKSLRKDGKVRLGVVFRDTDELNVSPDLSQSLCTALDNSEYLIVLCSPEYKESEWCRQEIVYFLKHHDIGNILPVLVNGTPSDAFPEEIVCRSIVDGKEIVSEPLAANVAGATIKEMKQNIKKEYLRLVAKMIGCHYDELIQRQKRYERQQKTAVLGTAFAVLLAFVALLLVKNAQVNSQYQEVRRSQAQYLSKLAIEQYEEGDTKSAAESVLKILPEGKDDGPVVPEQMYALSTIVNAYNNSYVPKNFISLPERDQKVFSGDQTLLFSYSSYLLEVYDTAYGRVQYTFEPRSFARSHTELAEKYSGLESLDISDIAPTEGGKFIVASSVCVFELDIDDNSYFKYIAPRGWDLYYKNGKVAVCSMGSVAVYDCATGEVLYENDFNSASGESSVTYLIKDLCWNEDASLFAIGLDYSNNAIQTGLSRNDPELNRQENEYFRNNPAIGLAVVDLATGELTKLSGQRTVEVSLAGSSVGAAHMEYPPYNVACNNVVVDSTPARWFAGVYDLGSGECSYQSDMLLGETYNSFGFSKGSITIDGNVRPVYELWIGKTGIILDAETNSPLTMESFRADIVAMEYHRDSMPMIVLSNGSIQLMSISEASHCYMRTSVMKLDTVVKHAVRSNEDYYLLTNTGMIQCSLSTWSGTTSVASKTDGLSDYQAKVFRYYDSEQGKLRLVGYEASGVNRADGSYSALEVYTCLGSSRRFSYVADDPNSTIKACNISEDGNEIFILEQKPDGSTALYCLDIQRDKLKYSGELSSKIISAGALTDIQSAGFSEDGKALWVTGQSTAHIYDLGEEAVCRAEYKSSSRIECPALTESGQYLVWVEKNSETKGSDLVFMDAKTGEIKTTGLSSSFGSSGSSCTVLPAQDNNVIVYDGNTELVIYDAEKRAFVDSIKVARGSEIALLGDKTELIAAREETLLLYDLQTGELTSQLDVPYTIGEIITDSGNDAFAVYVGGGYSSENDNGWFLGGWYLISVDENRDIYLTAFISSTSAYGSISPSGGEIISRSASESFEFMRVLSFEELVHKASLLK